MQGSRFNTSFQCYVSTDLERVSRNGSIFWYSSCTQDCSELLYRMWILIRTKTVHLDNILHNNYGYPFETFGGYYRTKK